ncbi:hypothetical protein BCR33DRAFT_191022 [Rhizoclosmatium globosum]|uniref:Uncharacterized protein n=1 Tax=Rhizoclosmatium globosum TaxID=329046 RepID=A0A1Y2D1R9_9FUNG|nr:hypothetical protein BCR33DRAFT_191022 [Rhizoclosmatium globosum]|eukprot:ORY53228.1 hypothetical protein BCR33DRAFT_191022 [Rhizoclosmatium globosum]
MNYYDNYSSYATQVCVNCSHSAESTKPLPCCSANLCLACFHLIRVASSSNTYDCKICSKTAPKSTLDNIGDRAALI